MKGGQKNFRGRKSFGVILAILLGAALLPVRAQDRFEEGFLKSTLSMENGLPCNYIDDICRDDAGFLWLATSGGGLKSNFIRNVCEDRFHRLWIASEDGLDLLDLGTLECLELPHPAGTEKSLNATWWGKKVD